MGGNQADTPPRGGLRRPSPSQQPARPKGRKRDARRGQAWRAKERQSGTSALASSARTRLPGHVDSLAVLPSREPGLHGALSLRPNCLSVCYLQVTHSLSSVLCARSRNLASPRTPAPILTITILIVAIYHPTTPPHSGRSFYSHYHRRPGLFCSHISCQSAAPSLSLLSFAAELWRGNSRLGLCSAAAPITSPALSRLNSELDSTTPWLPLLPLLERLLLG